MALRTRAHAIVVALASVIIAIGCRGGDTAAKASTAVSPEINPAAAQHRLAQTVGELQVNGLKQPVRVIRDRRGIPHIYANSADDLFLAQGFVQAQDRLFQIDLWRRSVQGRLAEILGPNFVERDRLARLMHYRGDMDVEWVSYAPDARQIVGQFVKGINAWVEIARRNPPLEFALAGYLPETWEPEDLLSRAEGFTMGGNALGEVFRSRLTALVGLEKATQLLPPEPSVPVLVSAGIDLGIIDERIQTQLLTIGAGARFTDVQPVSLSASAATRRYEGSNNWVIDGRKSTSGRPLLANDPHRNLDHPSLRYLVHLNAPGWNVIGAVQPYLPGVSVGHNDRVAWGLTIFLTDAQDLYVEKLDDTGRRYQYQGKWLPLEAQSDRIRVKGGADVDVEHLYTRHGPVVSVDANRHQAVALRWAGDEPGTVGYLGNLSLDRAANAREFRAALVHHKMPAENFVYADVDGNIGYQAAGLSPIRKGWPGLLPVPGWTGENEWHGWFTLDDLPHAENPASGWLATANNNVLPPGEKKPIGYEWLDPARINRIREVLGAGGKFDITAFERLQHDAIAWNAEQLVPLLEHLPIENTDADRARRLLLGWDRAMARSSVAATIYATWEDQLVATLIADKITGPLAAEFVARGGDWLVPALTHPNAAWFGQAGSRGRDVALVTALTEAVAGLKTKLGPDMNQWKWERLHTATFRHPLGVNPSLASLFNVGPIPRDGYALTPFSTGGPSYTQTIGATFREIMDLSDWDRSVATSAPGQSGQPGSPHFSDLAKLWEEGQYFSLPFTETAVRTASEATLTLMPSK